MGAHTHTHTQNHFTANSKPKDAYTAASESTQFNANACIYPIVTKQVHQNHKIDKKET